MSITLRTAALADLPAIAELYGSVCDGLQGRPYNPGWRRDGFPTAENALDYLEKGTVLLAFADSELAGSVSFTRDPSAEDGFENAPEPDESIAYIHVMAVHPAFSRRGISGALLSGAANAAARYGVRTLRLYVWEGNFPAIGAYKKAGYTCVQDGVDIGLAEFGLERFSLYEKAL